MLRHLFNVPIIKWLNPKNVGGNTLYSLILCIFTQPCLRPGLDDYLRLPYLSTFSFRSVKIYSSDFYYTVLNYARYPCLVVLMLPWMFGAQVSSGVTNTVSSNQFLLSGTFFIMDYSIGVFLFLEGVNRWFLSHLN